MNQVQKWKCSNVLYTTPLLYRGDIEKNCRDIYEKNFLRQKKVPKKILKILVRLKINFGFLKAEKTQAHVIFEKRKGILL